MPFDTSALHWDTWEIDPSTRDNTHLWTKWVPVDVTLTTPGTAQNLYLINPEYPTVNIATNPSFETGAPPTGYTGIGATLAQSAVVARNGTNSMSITPDNVAVGEGGFWTSNEQIGGPDSGSNQLYFVISAYFNDNAGSGNTARIEIRDTAGILVSAGNTVTLAASWQRSVARVRLTPAAAQYRAYFVTAAQHGTVFYVDSFQPEINNSGNATVYCDGSLGNYYEWEGTAHASISRRRGGLVAIRGYTLYTTRNAFLAFDQTASSTLGRLARAGSDFWNDYPIHVARNISFINDLAGEQPRISGEIWGVHIGKTR